MDLRYLHTFLTIAEKGSFSRAAEELNYTQSTITFQMGQLEDELSAKLFEKIGRRMVLTKAGEQLIPYVKKVLCSIDQMCSFERDLEEYRGDLHIGAGESLLCYQLPPIIKEFHSRAPNARLFLQSMNCYDIRDALLSGTLDMGIFYSDVGGFGSNLTSYPFGIYDTALVTAPENKRKGPDFRIPDQRIPMPFLINETRCIYRQLFEKYLCEKSILMDYTIELWSIPTIKNLLSGGMGVSYLPHFTVQEELERGTLAEIQTDMESTQISAIYAHHKNKWISPLMQLFMDLCRDFQNR